MILGDKRHFAVYRLIGTHERAVNHKAAGTKQNQRWKVASEMLSDSAHGYLIAAAGSLLFFLLVFPPLKVSNCC